ncbi:MAG TPA: BlaI/MecI/CopY family transcriptional regulator [Gemmataceae bacterium]|jgi:predicted transcriptional regulator|nr:BlaI/MecI/CopY family transcriptional regulator [Gemmataceae bacterium]
MARTPRDVTDKELEVLQVLWDQGEANRRQITDALYPMGGAALYATVQKLLERLEDKSLVRHTRSGDGVLSFTAAVGREDFISRRLLDMAAKLCGGSLTPLLMNMVRAKPLEAGELQELRELVKELGQRDKRKGEKL